MATTPADKSSGRLKLQPATRSQVTVVDSIVTQIRDQILHGGVPPGAPLPSEAKMSERLGVSRATIREAVQVLEQMGLVQRQSGSRRGLLVAEEDERLTRMALRDLLQFRQMSPDEAFEVLEFVEPRISTLAAIRGSEDSLGRVRRHLEELKLAGSLEEAETAHEHLHDSIADASENRLFAIIWRSIDIALEPMKEQAFSGKRTLEGLVRLHVPLAEAVLDRDAVRAIEMTERHVAVFRSAHDHAVGSHREKKSRPDRSVGVVR